MSSRKESKGNRLLQIHDDIKTYALIVLSFNINT